MIVLKYPFYVFKKLKGGQGLLMIIWARIKIFRTVLAKVDVTIFPFQL